MRIRSTFSFLKSSSGLTLLEKYFLAFCWLKSVPCPVIPFWSSHSNSSRSSQVLTPSLACAPLSLVVRAVLELVLLVVDNEETTSVLSEGEVKVVVTTEVADDDDVVVVVVAADDDAEEEASFWGRGVC